MDPKIVIGLSFLENLKELKRMRESLPKDIPIIAINGAYDDFQTYHRYSLDGSKEYLLSFPNTEVIDYAALQPAKRQKYLDRAGELGYDYLIIMDSDEFVHPEYNDWNLFKENLVRMAEENPRDQLFFMEMWMPKDWDRAHNNIELDRFQKWGRVIKNPGSVKYAFWCHYRLLRKEFTEQDVITRKTDVLKAHHIIEGVRFATDSRLRTPDFLKRREKWAFNQMHAEWKKINDFFLAPENVEKVKEYVATTTTTG